MNPADPTPHDAYLLARVAGSVAPLLLLVGRLLVLATGFGSIMLSHVNGSGFWLIGSLFKIDVKTTLATWSVVETVLSRAGQAGVLVLSCIVK